MTRRESEAELRRERDSLRRQVQILKNRELLGDPLIAGARADELRRYVDALVKVAIEAWGPRGSSPDPRPKGGSDAERPVPRNVAGWAQDLFRREMRELGRRSEELEGFVERPMRPGHRRKKCVCGRGIARGHAFCPWCGQQHNQED